MRLDKGLLQVNTGDGKGKTTAALGQAWRASGRGLRVLVHQFFKLESEPSGEQLAPLPGITFRRGDYRHPFFDRQADRAVLRLKIQRALDQIAREMSDDQWDLVVLDENNNALRDGLVSWPEFLAFLGSKPEALELICTGRGAPAELLERADYVTEFKKTKHPIEKGQGARLGIEF